MITEVDQGAGPSNLAGFRRKKGEIKEEAKGVDGAIGGEKEEYRRAKRGQGSHAENKLRTIIMPIPCYIICSLPIGTIPLLPINVSI